MPKERYTSPEKENKFLMNQDCYNKQVKWNTKKIISLLDNTLNQLSRFRTKNQVEIHDESRRTYHVNSDIKFKITMLKSSLCDYSDAYILVTGTITVSNIAAWRCKGK